MKPCCEACERNKFAIADTLAIIFAAPGEVLEIGSGTGQHAVFFAAEMPHLTWHCSELADRHAGINAWISYSGLNNVIRPVEIDVGSSTWPAQDFDYAFSANTAHIMSWENVTNMFTGLAGVLKPSAKFALYGPFNIAGRFTSEGNRKFDRMLRAEHREMGIRHLEDVAELAASKGFSIMDNIAMPANNRLLVFDKA
ncbi:MAG: DUF938 domain-containing protein [Gammaproteobacteria bacterium]|nr:DUF938 domain-containing protein [Gammaproteobacteria bacterium]